MRRLIVLIAVLLVPCTLRGAYAKDGSQTQEQGTTPEEIAKIRWPAPSAVKVAVLPFWDYSSNVKQQRMASGASWMLFTRQGFEMLPLEASFKALDEDKKCEPGVPLRREDAVRIGKAIGATWVVYGEVKELRPYKKDSFFKQSKNLMAAMRLAVAEVPGDQLLYWKSRSNKIGGTGYFGGFQSKGETLKRTGVLSVSHAILEPLFAAMPKHTVTGNVPDSGDLAAFVDKVWPGDADKADSDKADPKDDTKSGKK